MAALARGGVDVLLLDDGFQHLGLDRDLDIVLLDCRSPFGNGFVLPAGPLREPISNLGRADAFVITHAGKYPDARPLKDELQRLFPGVPVFVCRHKMKGITLKKVNLPFRSSRFRTARPLLLLELPGRRAFSMSFERPG